MTNLKKIKYCSQNKEKTWESRVYLGISLNNSLTQDCNTLIEINSFIMSKVESYKLLVGDYLHRINTKIVSDLEDINAEKLVITMGNERESFISNCLSNVSAKDFIRTKSFYSYENFNKLKTFFSDEIDRDVILSKLLNNSIETYLNRVQISISYNDARRLCYQYIVEELVIFHLLVDMGFNTLVYPGSQLPILKHIIKENYSQFKNLTKMNLVELKFHK
jgi:tRNA-dependent cyclodipeptide synthase